MNKERNYVFKGMMSSGNCKQQIIRDKKEELLVEELDREIDEYLREEDEKKPSSPSDIFLQ